MLIKSSRAWEIPEAQATPEAVFANRRQVLLAAGGLGIAGLAHWTGAARAETPNPTADLYPMKRNPAFKLDRDLTPEKVNATYNNFYEFGSSKSISKAAQALKVHPWQVTIDGAVENPMVVDIDKLLRMLPQEERLYRHRCVEAWSMTIPWSGFSFASLVALARPLNKARYVQMETFHDPAVARGQKAAWYPWPYTEGLTIEEATNDLAFLATGAYGKPMAKQHGAPLRLAVPWKYGFKSIKSITRFTFTDKRPKTFWEEINAKEYGFWANVNPQVSHPRWSQATERVLGANNRVPTLLYNGYGEQVAMLYKDLMKEKLYM
ncbi:MAG: protein-methionine-sulfoxide reductase catalytic subunit MsrP [Alphaproteobacteria bacterium]